MKRKLILFFAIIIMPLLILGLDSVVFNEDINLDSSYDCSKEWKYIREHQKEFPSELLDLASRNKETIPFVANYPQKKNIPIQIEFTKDEVPHFLQWDEMWGYKKYGNEMMAINGCGPTSLSMVLVYLKQDQKYNPYYVAQYAQTNGYCVDGQTSWAFMDKGAMDLGLKASEIPLDEQIMIDNLKQKHPLICGVRKGEFTSTGHFIVVKKYEDGLFYVNDPNSKIKSQRGYTFEELAPQIKVMWAYSLKQNS